MIRLANPSLLLLILSLLFTLLDAKQPSASETVHSRVWDIHTKQLPLPSCASQEIQKTLAAIPQPDLARAKYFPNKTKEEWREWVDYLNDSGAGGAKRWAKKYHVHIKKSELNGVTVYYLTPDSQMGQKTKHLFVFLHGGAYVFGGGMSGLPEGILIASRTQMPVIAVDYRMPPDYPFPTAVEDTVKVYKSLLKTHDAKSLAMGGSSAGGALTLSVVHKLKALKLPLPAALFVGTPWSDLSKRGDSLFVNEGIDRKIISYDGFVAAAAKLYADGKDLKEEGLSPVYGDFTGFPPTMLVTGTRDLFLSLTVRVHRKMKVAGVTADLNVFEGLSHVEYFIVPDSKESLETYRELKNFLNRYLK